MYRVITFDHRIKNDKGFVVGVFDNYEEAKEAYEKEYWDIRMDAWAMKTFHVELQKKVEA